MLPQILKKKIFSNNKSSANSTYPNESKWIPKNLDGYKWILRQWNQIDPNKSKFTQMNPNGSKGIKMVQMDTNELKWVLFFFKIECSGNYKL